MTEKSNPKFTTVVRDNRLVAPKLDDECIRRQFLAAFTDRKSTPGSHMEWHLEYMVNIDVSGRQNQFEFFVPADLSVEAQRSLAWRLSECRARPALHRGQPVAVRYRLHIIWRAP